MSKRFKSRKNQLARSSDDRWILGVLGGVADYLGWSSNLVRALWIVLGIFFHKIWWVFVLVYIVAGIVLPED
ncbi:MAG: PspC domain-containing protein [Clostridia bacterium]|nr:PspC domain-containing protein [Clostridia bacterium]